MGVPTKLEKPFETENIQNTNFSTHWERGSREKTAFI